jgi:predicted DNA-binding transcriptional regulator AlpA
MSEKIEELHPNQIVRMNEGPKFFGYKATQLPEKIKSGEIPAPFPLSDTGRAKGWTGRQIIEHQSRRLAAAKPRSE